MHDTIIVGGSYAGISAGLQLARARRDVLVLDAGQRRNRTATASHGFLGQDGKDPSAIAAKGRAELLAYPTVTWQDAPVIDARPVPGGFAVRAGTDEHRGRRLVLATGVVDELPAIPGLSGTLGANRFPLPVLPRLRARPGAPGGPRHGPDVAAPDRPRLRLGVTRRDDPLPFGRPRARRGSTQRPRSPRHSRRAHPRRRGRR